MSSRGQAGAKRVRLGKPCAKRSDLSRDPRDRSGSVDALGCEPGKHLECFSDFNVCIKQPGSCCKCGFCFCGSGFPEEADAVRQPHIEELGPSLTEGCRKPTRHEMVRCIQGTPAGC